MVYVTCALSGVQEQPWGWGSWVFSFFVASRKRIRHAFFGSYNGTQVCRLKESTVTCGNLKSNLDSELFAAQPLSSQSP